MAVNTSSDTAQLENLIRELNDPRNQGVPHQIDSIQKQIQALQRDSSAWRAGLVLLKHNDPQMRFYGALTLTIKVNADWENDRIGEDRDLFNTFLEELITSYVALAAADEVFFVINKLCTTLVAVFQKPNSAWALPLRHVLACTVSGQYLRQEASPQLSELLNSDTSLSARSLYAVMLLALTLAEDAVKIADASRSSSVLTRMSNNTNDVWQLIHFCTVHILNARQGTQDQSQYRLQVRATENQWIDIAKITLRAAPWWATSVPIKTSKPQSSTTMTLTDLFRSSFQNFVIMFYQDLAEPVVQTFTSLEQTSHTLLRHTLPDYAEEVLSSSQAEAWIKELLVGGFESDAIAYVDYLEALMNQVDVTSPKYLEEAQNVKAIQQLQMLLRCEGTAGVENPVCQVSLEVLTTVIEGHGDWPAASQFDESMRAIAADSCSACIAKARMPLEEMKMSTQTWDTDDRAKFQDYRFEAQDFLQNAFEILGKDLIKEIVKAIVAPDSMTNWNVFEADLYGLLAFSDTIAGEPETYDEYLAAVLGCNHWTRSLSNSSQTPDKVRQTVIKFIGESTGYLQRHPQSLVSCLDFLFESLHIPGSGTAASKAILTLCDTQRTSLTDALPNFMQSLDTITDLEQDARNRILTGVSAIIQALPDEQAKLAPLSALLTLTEATASNIHNSSFQRDETDARSASVMLMLAAIGRGLRAPSDVINIDDHAPVSEITFWTNGGGSSVQQRILQLYKMLQSTSSDTSDDLLVEATCDFLRYAFTEDHPSPFKFHSATTVAILTRLISASNAQPDLIMGTTSSYLASAPPEEEGEFASILQLVTQRCQQALSPQQEQVQSNIVDFCAAALGLCSRLLPKWSGIWFASQSLRETIQIIPEVALILIDNPDTMTRRAAASFLAALLEASGSIPVLISPEASSAMDLVVQTYGPRIMAAILRLIGGECARSELETLAEPLKKFMQKQPRMANRLVKEAVKAENGVLTPRALEATKPEQRARLAAQIEMLRGARKTNEVVKEFWIACKGSSFGYIT